MRPTTATQAVCEFRLAVGGRRRDPSGTWVDDPEFFWVTCFGRTAETAVEHLSKGYRVAINGRLDQQEWDDKESGERREAVKVIAHQIHFLKPPSGDGIEGDEQTAGAGAEDDIPF